MTSLTNPPEWATHVAKSKIDGREEFCAWLEQAQDYIDEDPKTAANWAGGYKHAYWEFKRIERAHNE